MSDFGASMKKKKTNKFSGRNYWRQEGIGSHTVLREPKAEGYHRKWAGDSHGCYSCRQPVHKKKGMLQVSKNAGIVTNKSAQGPKAGI